MSLKYFFGVVTIVFVLLLSLFINDKAYGASATATARQVVITALSITNTSDLDFGTAPQGDPAKTVAPSDATAASFNVAGQSNYAYTITLPSTAQMTTAGGGTADKTINVSTFTSNPSSSGTLDAAGNQVLKVGATRDALLATQQPGSYTGTFTVTVIY